ncbi:unnamed protein product [Phytomonas sp. EM1]|nr:unnamed protein product [Phytomonas sp. EM1]|eukprot:CCW60495.1 unnamed protein product [Phytomonas sp. isolate EM1]
MELLETLIAETTRQWQMLDAFFEQRAQRGGGGGESIGEDVPPLPPPPHEPHFMVLIQPLLGFHHLLNRQEAIHHNLDDACQAILEWNCFAALDGVLRKHENLLAAIPDPCESSTGEGGAEGASRGEIPPPGQEALFVEGEQIHPSPLVVVEKERHRLRETLKELFVAAAIRFYFTHDNPICGGLLSDLEAALSAPEQEGAVAATSAKLKRMVDVHAVMAVLHNLYNLIASTGGLPKLPLLPALNDPSEREKLQQHVVTRVLEVYAFLYAVLEHKLRDASSSESSIHSVVKLNDEEASMFADMDPAKLRMLMDA